MEKNIYKEAILDAKAVRASAIANAKAALQETIEPKIQEMMRLKLSEELEEELDEEVEEENISEEIEEESVNQEGATIDEASLDEILKELESMEEGYEEESIQEEVEESVNEETEEEGEKVVEAKKEEEEEEEEAEEEEGEEEEESGETPAGEEAPEVDDETKVIDITLGDLKQVLQSVMAQTTDAGMEDLEANVPDEMKGDEAGDDSISLDEILDELEQEGYASGEQTDAAGAGEIEEAKDAKEVEKELEEAKKTIEALRESMNEINLLNAKLLYMNKIFKSKSLTESQKIKVIKAFDRSTSVKEVKNTYETLKESFNGKKEQIKESVGFASKPIGTAPKTPIVESNNFVERWQKIAGIK